MFISFPNLSSHSRSHLHCIIPQCWFRSASSPPITLIREGTTHPSFFQPPRPTLPFPRYALPQIIPNCAVVVAMATPPFKHTDAEKQVEAATEKNYVKSVKDIPPNLSRDEILTQKSVYGNGRTSIVVGAEIVEVGERGLDGFGKVTNIGMLVEVLGVRT
ncbi:hypothetical protein PIB30_061518 [Stylosanthes scabra]|uniref:Uncharacterized protein n=1 Tax=Stylosanthes scabra TaxID=79078 RepID=A0ABU6WKS0_9FABA|nr:hypothetical protein [Stylosanthes scabra]